MELAADEYIQRGFRPSLERLRLDQFQRNVLQAYGIPLIGEPGPTRDGRKGAYWKGDFNKNGEAAVLVATTFTQAEFVLKSHWYLGVLAEDVHLLRQDTSRVCIEVAEYPVESLELALHALSCFLAPVDPDAL